ncbi:sigma-70 family RNA polymerase sigma factor [Mycobacterium sp. NPDC051804]|uniref:sigma-70 family RNA polymerase sigma factor n=1 Tax=Mycobacterium sp. NPDC051804 TaxID=3364295 RepID=UPI00378DFEC2
MKVVTATPESEADRAARFTSEVEPLHDMLARGARRLTRSDADAEDLLQDALMHAYAGFHTFAGGTNVKAWLFRILHNRWVSGYRSKQRRPAEVCIDDVTEVQVWGGVRTLADAPQSAEVEFLDALPDNEIKSALATLPEGSRTAIYYADVLDYTYAETAVLMDVPIGTVMSRVARGRKRLRFALAHLASVGSDVAALEPDIA